MIRNSKAINSLFALLFSSASLVVGMLYLSQPVVAQVAPQAQTLFSNETSIGTENLGFFVAPAFGITAMDGSAASLLQLRGGLNIKDKFSFGAYFNTSINEINPESETVQNVYMDYWSVGGFAEYTLLAKRAFHVTFPFYVGFGEVQMD